MATQSGTELRSFVHLGDEDNCYLKTEKGGDPPENWGVELGKIEACLARLDASLATPIDGESIVRKRNALRQQGISLLTIEIQPHNMTVP